MACDCIFSASLDCRVALANHPFPSSKTGRVVPLMGIDSRVLGRLISGGTTVPSINSGWPDSTIALGCTFDSCLSSSLPRIREILSLFQTSIPLWDKVSNTASGTIRSEISKFEWLSSKLSTSLSTSCKVSGR